MKVSVTETLQLLKIFLIGLIYCNKHTIIHHTLTEEIKMLFAEFSAIILMMILAALALMFAFGVLLLGWLIDVVLSIVNDLKLLKTKGLNDDKNNQNS